MSILLKGQIVNLESLCPWCSGKGQPVGIETVKSLCPDCSIDEDRQYCLCLSPECSAAYFSWPDLVFTKELLSVPIWFKEESPVPICYCQNVTDLEIWEHIAISCCCANLDDIQAHTGANTGCECKTKNPSGK